MANFKSTGLLLAVAIGLSFQTISHALDFVWVGDADPNSGLPGTNNLWINPFNWLAGTDPNGTPIIGPVGAGDDARITNGGFVQVKFNPGSIDDLDLFNGTLHIIPEDPNDPTHGVLTVILTEGGNGDFDQRGTSTLIVDVGGVLNIGDDYIFRGGTTTVRGTMIVGSDGNGNILGWGPSSVLNIEGDAFMRIFDNITVGAGGSMTLSGNSLVEIANDMNVDGTLTLTGNSKMIVIDDYDVETGGLFIIDPNGTLHVSDNFDIKNAGFMETRGTLIINNDIDVEDGGTWRNSGDATVGEFDMAGTGTYIAHITKGGFNNDLALQVRGLADLEGTLVVDFENASTDVVGNFWDLIEAGRIEGSFDNIIITGQKAAGLLANQGIGFSQLFTGEPIPGFTTTFRISIEQRLELQLDRSTGAALIVNASLADPNATAPVSVGLDGYTIESVSGSLDAVGWSSLAAQSLDPNNPSWFELPEKTSNSIGELNAFGSETLLADGSVAIGTPYVYDINNATSFGEEIEDVVFTFVNSKGVTVDGLVTYTGDKQSNNIVLTVDPATGNATMQNESPFTVDIELYTITSDDSSLVPTWDSLDDQGEATWLELNSERDRLAEFLSGDPVALHRNYGYSLDGLFNTASTQDLIFQFLLAGSTTFIQGVVVYGDLPTNLRDPDFHPADFNNSGVVDGADLAIWEANYGTTGATKAQGDFNADGIVDGKDFLGWQLNLGHVGPLVAGDFDLDRDVDGSDFLKWQRGESPIPLSQSDLNDWEMNYGTVAPLSASSAAVPEPTTFILSLLGLAASVIIHRRNSKA